MKLVICHHNGQIAEYTLDNVTGLSFQPDNGLEELTPAASALNDQLAGLLNPARVVAPPAPDVTPDPAPAPAEAPVDPPVAEPSAAGSAEPSTPSASTDA